MTLSHEELFQRYLHAGAFTRNADAVAALFTEDGVYEAPLVPLHFAGRDAIRVGVAALHRQPPPDGAVDLQRSAYVLHETADPDVFITEIDTVFDTGRTIALAQIFRVHGDQITRLRDYFHTP
ncbi:nuclear transport factor 2 family protein [Actinoplanes sp. NPDC049596]|uniref:nuclear transport factor 2 family protein n=1 Tax=unclassified Actinoplanes TaxID=2626549 RepID=UPI003419B8DB